MPTYLVIANQTLGGRRLGQELRDRVARGNARFRVVVPMTQPENYATNWSMEGMHHFEPAINDPTDALERARQQSERRLRDLIRRVEQEGGEVEGELGDADPLVAAEDALERYEVDEVIVSTLPAGMSRWLKMDFASRLDRKVDVPVTIIEADPQD